jgi:UDP-N-acetyl-D-galactosamine dehydrogenase
MKSIAIIGLGYVGLPLAVEFGKQRKVIGYDIDQKRIDELKTGHDRTNEVSDVEMEEAGKLEFTSDLADLSACGFYIVTVPTPIDAHKKPDLRPLEKSSEAIASILKKGDIVIYESTVFPGCTEDVCVPILEEE